MLDYIGNNATVIRKVNSSFNDQQWQQLLKIVVSPIPIRTDSVIPIISPPSFCQASRVQAKNVSHFPNLTPEAALAAACRDLLEVTTISPQLDAILIDEGQDLIIDDDTLKFEGKQPFYWMAYQALRSPEANTPELRRLIWAYDEAQSLNSLVIPTSKQVLGSELSQIIGGSSGGFYLGKIRKAHVLKRSYRTPRCILAAAQALGMGLLPPNGMLTGITNKKDWERIGYQVTQGDFRIPGTTVTLIRPQENSPNPIRTLWDKELISFQSYSSRQVELKALANSIKHNIENEKLNPSQDILVIVLGSTFEVKKLQQQTANHLLAAGINYYIPTAPTINCFPNNSQNVFPNRFWNPDSVTVSGIHRAKGNEASVVYIVGLDYIARNESNITARNQLFTGMTRTRAWLYLSGIDNYPMYQEIRQVIQSDSTFTFTFQRPKRDVSE